MKKDKHILLLKFIYALVGILYLYLFLLNPFEKNINQSFAGLLLSWTLLPIFLFFRKNEIKKFSFGLIVVLIGIIIYFVI